MAELKEARVPDIGGHEGVPVIELLVKVGDTVAKDQGLVTLESDKATMEVPAPFAGIVKELKIKVGDKVSQGTAIMTVEAADGAPAAAKPAAPTQAASGPAAAPAPAAAAPATPAAPAAPAAAPAASGAAPAAALTSVDEVGFAHAHASPSVRRFARELGVDLGKVKGSGPKDRILKEDVQAFVKTALARPAAAAGGTGVGINLLPMPVVDFTKFGPV